MNKAILVIDMPKNCRECTLAQNKTIPLEEAYSCTLTRKWVIDKECDSRPSGCPLKEVPEKMQVCGKYPQPDGIVPSYKIGYNACIDEILRSEYAI